jgi:hypothetical protein
MKTKTLKINKKERKKIDSNIAAIQKAVSSLKDSKRMLKNFSNRRESQKISMNISSMQKAISCLKRTKRGIFNTRR